MHSAINPLLELLVGWVEHLEINDGTGGEGVGVGIPEVAALKEKCEGKWNKVTAWIDGMAVFAGGRCFR